MKKVVLTTGGTGGHIYPALAIAKELNNKEIETIFIGTKHRMERDIIPKEGYRFEGLDVIPLKSIKSFIKMAKAIRSSYKILKKEEIEAVIGFGNYISVPALIAALILRKKIYLQEQNVKMGFANKMFYKFATKTFVSFDETFEEIGCKYHDRIISAGNPLREEFFRKIRKEERERLKIEKDEKMVLVIGGSLGAKSINDAVIKNTDTFFDEKKVRLYWATGKDNFQKINESIGRLKNNDIIRAYFENIPALMAAADVVVCRAGASTISELIEMEKPAILIPYDYVGQKENGMVMVRNGSAMMFEDEKADEAFNTLFELIKDNEKLKEMASKAKSIKKGNSVKKILDELDIWRT
jgi:UDP-N-acetylglucosamine--N-acetylmuramyl-(pentapeptide) pyrophosphoryl-undecaprenol N-acetylglucosamine transferase